MSTRGNGDDRAIWGSAQDDVVRVGQYPIHFDGASWRGLPYTGYTPLRAVWGSGPDDVHAAAEDGGIFHYRR